MAPTRDKNDVSHTAAVEIERLVAALVEGDERAFEALYEKTSPYVFGLLLKILGSRARAEEVAQDVYLQIWQTAPGFDPERSSALAWIGMIARSRAIDRVRSEGSYGEALGALERRSAAQPFGEPAADPESWTSAAERRELVGRALAQLPREQRDVLELAFFHGESHRGVAARTGVPLGTVKSRIRAAIGKLEKALAPYLAEGPASGGGAA